MRLSNAAFFALSCALVFAACDIPPEPVDEEDMTEQELQIKKIFYIENENQFFIEYSPFDYYSRQFYEDYDGRLPFNPIDYITNLNPSQFTRAQTDIYSLFCATYSGATASLPTQADLNREKMVYIYTKEEGSGGIPGLGPPEAWVATGKARIRVSSVPIHVLYSADSMITLETTSTPPTGVSFWDFAYADDTVILFYAYYGSKPVTYAYFRGSGTWQHVIDEAPRRAVKTGGKLHLLAGGALYESADGGSTWVKSAHSFLEGKKLTSVCAGDGLFYVAYETGLAVSSDGGVTWTETGTLPLSESANDIALLKGALYLRAGNDKTGGIFTSSDGGLSWTKLALVPSSYSEFFNGGDYLYSYTASGFVRLSGGTFKPIDIPVSGESLAEGNGENGIFVCNFWRYGGYGVNLNIGDGGPWYFLSKGSDYSGFCRVIGNRIAIMHDGKLGIYRISGL
jgi:hypothetical protein